jgi:hypothetical protein
MERREFVMPMETGKSLSGPGEKVKLIFGRSVMMGWEEPLMKEHVRLMCHNHPKMASGEGLNILNIGYGLGIVSGTRS